MIRFFYFKNNFSGNAKRADFASYSNNLFWLLLESLLYVELTVIGMHIVLVAWNGLNFAYCILWSIFMYDVVLWMPQLLHMREILFFQSCLFRLVNSCGVLRLNCWCVSISWKSLMHRRSLDWKFYSTTHARCKGCLYARLICIYYFFNERECTEEADTHTSLFKSIFNTLRD